MRTVKVKVSEAGNAALNWAAAIAMGWHDVQITGYDDPDSEEEVFFRPAKVVGGRQVSGSGVRWNPTNNLEQGSAILFEHRISIHFCTDLRERNRQYVHAECGTNSHHGYSDGHDKPLVAGIRCLVKSKLGEVIEVPLQLVNKAEYQLGNHPRASESPRG